MKTNKELSTLANRCLKQMVSARKLFLSVPHEEIDKSSMKNIVHEAYRTGYSDAIKDVKSTKGIKVSD